MESTSVYHQPIERFFLENNSFKNHEFRYWKSKAVLIKEMILKSYFPDWIASNLLQISHSICAKV